MCIVKYDRRGGVLFFPQSSQTNEKQKKVSKPLDSMGTQVKMEEK